VSWWYLSAGHAGMRVTVAVKVENGIVVDGPPIMRKYIGKSAKEIGNYYRQRGIEFTAKRMAEDNPYLLTHEYVWGNNAKREKLKGRMCRIVSRGQMRSVMVEFENGQREIASFRSLRERREV